MNSSSQSSTYSASMGVPKDCSTCFYYSIPKESPISPCRTCVDYSKHARDSIYFWGKEEVTKMPEYDVVEKPKHYMLFPEKNIEVRDVIHALLGRMAKSDTYEFDPIDYADYVQAMQYFLRFMDKNGVEDLRKGVWYMNKIIENWEDE